MSYENDQITPLDEQNAHAYRSSEARKSNPAYELFVLGELMQGPQHGYKLNEIINHILGPQRQLSWGTLYPLIRRLEREGLITIFVDTQHETAPQERRGRGQPRRAYTITEKGRELFFELMCQPQGYAYHPELFTVQLSKFNLLLPQERLNVLERYRRYLESSRSYYHNALASLRLNPRVREDECPFAEQLVDYNLHMLGAEIAWFEHAIAKGRDG
ncbi:hypothetical protein KSC_043260 [Ktedonobacter sp. SOSP1-52]|uniref:PadR family transcriptional regulator n=1 Tax=Ktedonobacter sp. SOSP1-52 TaxID=2778366 RepID=UPI0019168214|nr:PadR family transcriptional regulator [Ktedonobacter sp. SOSP1-52]GHO65434.1 hypothetical protein KSC_043260 [Ktedonobacter sp. SOSP1-52]